MNKYCLFFIVCSHLQPLTGLISRVNVIKRIREEKKEERRRRELERKRLRDEERRKWREEERRKRKESDKMKKVEKPLEKDRDQGKEPKIKVCVTATFTVVQHSMGWIWLIFFCAAPEETREK